MAISLLVLNTSVHVVVQFYRGSFESCVDVTESNFIRIVQDHNSLIMAAIRQWIDNVFFSCFMFRKEKLARRGCGVNYFPEKGALLLAKKSEPCFWKEIATVYSNRAASLSCVWRIGRPETALTIARVCLLLV